MRRLLILLALVVASGGVSAGTLLVLEDGQVLQASDVRRDGDLYVIELESGGSLSIPVSLVREVRLGADKPSREAPQGMTYAEGQNLAGPGVEPLRPGEAQEVFGEPSRFKPSVVDPTWKPRSGFPDGDVLADSRSTWSKGVVDPTWKPKSGFPDDDVLAGSRSTWSKGMDNTWTPEDGFEKKKLAWQGTRTAAVAPGASTRGARVHMTGARRLTDPATESVDLTASAHGGWYEGFAPTRKSVPFRFRIPSTSTRGTAAVRDCAREVLQASGPVTVKALSEGIYAQLPVRFYQVSGETDEDAGRAAFTVEGGTCRAISGDLRDPLGVRLSRSHTMSRGVEAYDAALDGLTAVLLKTSEEKIDYAFAVVSLIDPDVTGAQDASLTLLGDPDGLKSLAEGVPDACGVSGSKQKKAARRAAQVVEPPRVVAQGGFEKVELYTWSSVHGDVVLHTVLIAGNGAVSVARETVASHVGAHSDRGE